MKTRYQILGLAIYFIATIFVIVINKDKVELISLYIPIYYMIGLLLFFIGQYIGEERYRKIIRDYNLGKQAVMEEGE